MVLVEAEAHAVSPIGGFSCFCIFCGPIVDRVGFDIGCAGAHDGDDADVGLHQMVQGQLLTWIVDRDDEQIIQCLEHVRPHDLSFPFFLFMASWHDYLGLCGLSLMKARANRRVMETAQGACAADLEDNNAKLLAELEQACLALIEADVV
jgi:hypothetical protein